MSPAFLLPKSASVRYGDMGRDMGNMGYGNLGGNQMQQIGNQSASLSLSVSGLATLWGKGILLLVLVGVVLSFIGPASFIPPGKENAVMAGVGGVSLLLALIVLFTASSYVNLDEAFDGQTSTAKLDPIQSTDLLDRELQRKPTARPVAARPVSLAERLVGKWQAVEGKKKGIVEFTKGGTALVSWNDPFPNALGNSGRRATLKYNVTGNTLKLEEPGDNEYRQKQEMQIEVISDDEIIFVVQKRAMSFDWLEGRVQRVN